MRDREIEQVSRLLGVSVLEPAKVSRRIGANRVRSMAVCAILVEQASPRSGPVGVALMRVLGCNRRIVRARISCSTWQTKEYSNHARPGEDRGSDLRRAHMHAARLSHDSRRYSRPAQSDNAKTNSAPPS